MPADILIYAIVAAGLVFWLRNILGARHGDERDRPNPFTSRSESRPETIKNKAAPEMGLTGAGLFPDQATDIGAGLERNMSIDGEAAEHGLVEIARNDRTFELSHFLRGAQDAFILIIESFAAADKETLKGLLSESVYKAFEGVIDERKKKGETASVEIHSIRKSEAIDAWIKNKMAYITVRFTADETSVVRDRDGKVIFGDPDRITETVDIWTFGRALRSRDPAWLLYETREHEDDEVAESTVPETNK